VEIAVRGEALMVRKRDFTLTELLAGVRPENLHGEIETGRRAGKEER